MLFRVLTVRKHKSVTFCDAYCFEDYRQQLLIPNEIMNDLHLIVGSTINVIWHEDINHRGVKVCMVDKIIQVYFPKKNTSYKSFKIEENTELDNLFSQDINGGIHLLRWKHYNELINRIESLMNKMGIIKITTPFTTSYRGTSVANPVKITGEYIGKKYIKITHELGLKRWCYLSLAPVFECGYVLRDRYVTQTALNEFLMFEAVIPNSYEFCLKDFYLKVIIEAKSIADALGLEYNRNFDDINIVDVKKEYDSVSLSFSKEKYIQFYEEISRKYRHVIFVNAPLNSPLGWQNEQGMVLETKWLLNGHGIGHGYYDEYRYDVLLVEFKKQKKLLEKKGIIAELPMDYLKCCEYCGIPTFSFNIGIERFFSFFFNTAEEN